MHSNSEISVHSDFTALLEGASPTILSDRSVGRSSGARLIDQHRLAFTERQTRDLATNGTGDTIFRMKQPRMSHGLSEFLQPDPARG